jgi:membrane protein YqaA with SNARE-associated domain
LKRFAESRKENMLIAFWAFSEACIWFVFPDFILLILGILSPQKLWKYLTISIIASSLGGLLMMYLCVDHVNLVEKYLFHLPFTNLGMLNHLKTLENNFGNLSYFLQAFSGIPFKVWTYQAVSQNRNIPIYFVFVFFWQSLMDGNRFIFRQVFAK